jgi:enoyl-CoA hydratase/carnithine racemase
MAEFILTAVDGQVGIITLNRPAVLNAWHKPMRDELVAAFDAFEVDETVRAIILTGAGERAFGAGQDLNETKTFDVARAELWMDEWERLYRRIRTLSKPLVAALNGVAAGSAFQVALLADVRVGHPGTSMGQPEINAGIGSITGPWIMREMLGLSRTVELTLTGRMMGGEECHRIGLIHRLVAREEVMAEALRFARELAAKPPVAMRLDKAWLAEMTEAGFRQAFDAGKRAHRVSYATGEPRRMMEKFLADRAARRRTGPLPD